MSLSTACTRGRHATSKPDWAGWQTSTTVPSLLDDALHHSGGRDLLDVAFDHVGGRGLLRRAGAFGSRRERSRGRSWASACVLLTSRALEQSRLPRQLAFWQRRGSSDCDSLDESCHYAAARTARRKRHESVAILC